MSIKYFIFTTFDPFEDIFDIIADIWEFGQQEKTLFAGASSLQFVEGQAELLPPQSDQIQLILVTRSGGIPKDSGHQVKYFLLNLGKFGKNLMYYQIQGFL